MIGRRLGSYEIVAKLGEGGMGEVYRARDLKLAREVAVKVLPEAVASDPERLARFEREARAIAALNHPHICTIHEIAEHGDRLFIVMEHIDGQPLSALADEPLPPSTVVRYGAQIADALAHAHDRGLIHRDLKGANLMVTTDGRVKVLDFGIATLASEPAMAAATRTATAPGAAAGTTGYIAPEVLKGAPADRRSDIWALGVVLYEMASGRHPFEGTTASEVTSAILRDDPRPLPKNVGAPLKAIIARCLAKEPALRYQQAGEVRAALEAIAMLAPARTPAVARAKQTTKPRATPSPDSLSREPQQEEPSPRPLRRRASDAERKPSDSIEPRIDSLAVLPLENLSRDPEQEFFADGMTDALITDLAQIPDLRVIARTSVMRFKGLSKPLPEIARDLNVSGIVTGSVLRAGDRVRISVQLAEPRTDRVVWAQRYERPLSDILSLQDDVARAVAGEIRASTRAAPTAAPRLVNSEVYVECLKARHHWHRYSEPEVRKAMVLLEGALAKDPSYAPAYAGLAICHNGLGWLGAELPRKTFPRAKDLARRALALDDGIAEAYCALGYVETFYDWDAAEAERTLRRALELQPGSADSHLFYAWLQNSIGNHQGAQTGTRRALELDPLSPLAIGNAAYLAIFDRRYEDAEYFSRQALDLDPSHALNRWSLGIALTCQGRQDKGIGELEAAASIWPGPSLLGWLGYACARGGRSDRARELLAQLEAMSPERVARSTEIARVLVGLGDYDRALAALSDACDQREGALGYMGSDPCWDPVADDPRFLAILKRRGLSGRSRPIAAAR